MRLPACALLLVAAGSNVLAAGPEPRSDGDFLRGLGLLRGKILARINPKRSGFTLVWNEGGCACRNAAGEEGLNTTAGEHVLATKRGECSDQAGAFVFRGGDLSGSDLSGADLRRADLAATDLRGAGLLCAKLAHASLGAADLSGARLELSDLSRSDLRGAALLGASLRGAVLAHATLTGADLGAADLLGASLKGAELGGADLRDADLRGADLRGARFDSKTRLPFDLQEAAERGMESAAPKARHMRSNAFPDGAQYGIAAATPR